MCTKKIVIERTRDLIYLKFVATDFFPKIISPSAGENSGDLARTAILPSSLQRVLLLVLSQINTIASFAKVKTSDFQTHFTMSSGLFALLTSARHSVKVTNNIFCLLYPRKRANTQIKFQQAFPATVVTDCSVN